MAKLPYLISKYSVKEIINFGIAGALDLELEQSKIYPIRTIYSYLETRPQFKSFTLSESKGARDCISSLERVTKTEQAQNLSSFAAIVDRELWGIAYAANTLKIKLRAFKLISDFANESTDCLSIKDRALEFSDAMFEFYCTLDTEQTLAQSSIDLGNMNASFTQRKRIEKLLKLLEVINPDKGPSHYRSKFNKDLSQKSNINDFCDFLEANINEVESSLFSKVFATLDPFKEIGASVSLDKKKESSDFTLQMKINSSKNITNLQAALSNFNYQEYLKSWEGDV